MAVLAFLAIAMKVVVPGGYMIQSPIAGEGPGLVLCTAEGLVTVPVDAHGVPTEHPDDDPSELQPEPCVFAGHGVSAPSVLAAALPGPAWTPILLVAAPAADNLVPGRGLAAPPPPATGPPPSLA